MLYRTINCPIRTHKATSRRSADWDTHSHHSSTPTTHTFLSNNNSDDHDIMDNELGTSAETFHPSMMRLNAATGGGIDSRRSQGTMTQQHECTCGQPDCIQPELYRTRAHAGGMGVNSGIPSPQSSPRSAALPSPPDSPAPSMTDSMSSFPSVGSSFFFSSGAASPHHPHAHRGAAGGGGRRRTQYSVSDPESGVESGVDPMHALIIPSLTLPAPVPQPTAHGQTLGEVTLLLVGNAERGRSGARALAEFLADADDVVDVCDWEDFDGEDGGESEGEVDGHAGEASDNGQKEGVRRRNARVLHASTDWLEERDLHGLERYEGRKNVAFVELEDIDDSESSEAVIQSISQRVLDMFRDISSHLAGSPSSPLLHALLASGNSTLCTALVYITSSPQSSRDKIIISSLAKLLPVIPLSASSVSYIQAYHDRDLSPHRDRHLRTSHYESPFPITSNSIRSHSQSREHERGHSSNITDFEPASASPFTPQTPSALRAGLFRSPHALASLRTEAASRFFRWREVERALGNGEDETDSRSISIEKRGHRDLWSKLEWEMELSSDYARRLNEIRSRSGPLSSHPHSTPSEAVLGFVPVLDPLHLPSVMLLSLSLFSPFMTSRNMLFSERQRKNQELNLVHTPTLSSPTDQLEAPAQHQARSSHGYSNEPKVKAKRHWTTTVKWGIVLVGAFCAGVGFGLVMSSSAQ